MWRCSWRKNRFLLRAQKLSQSGLVMQHRFYLANWVVNFTIVVLNFWNLVQLNRNIFVFDAVLNKLAVLLHINFTDYSDPFGVTLSPWDRVSVVLPLVEGDQAFWDFQRLFHNLLNNFGLLKPAWLLLWFLLNFPRWDWEFVDLLQIYHSWVQNLRLVLRPLVARNLEKLVFFGRDTQNIPVEYRLLFLHPFSPPVECCFLNLLLISIFLDFHIFVNFCEIVF